MEEIKSWGYHLMLDCGSAPIEKIADYDNIYKFVKQLVKDIDMIAYGEPQIVKFGNGNKAGYTLIQLISTSNIAAHFCEENGDFYLDVFSCKPFDPAIVIDLVDEYFKPASVRDTYLERQA